ncbi:MAG: multicopper oxidase family protein [Gemmatimonadales bacterium]
MSHPRHLPRLSAAVASCLLLGVFSVPAAHPMRRIVEPADTLRSPPVLANISTTPGTVEVNLTAEPARVALLPGHVTDAYTYNGTVPGPTLDVREGDRVIIHFRNHLPEPTTIHWHGLHIPADMDGSPLRPVAAGGQYDYVFTIPRGTAGTYWYHPHPDARTGYQIAKGLFGAIIVRDPHDPLPAALPEKLLILSDNRFAPDGSPEIADSQSMQGLIDQENGREGNVLLVNGQVMPVISIRSGEVQRWRVINVSAARIYRLAIPGQSLIHVGDDGGLFDRPVTIPEFLLANSERVELLVRGAGAPDSRTTLRDLPYDRYDPHTRPADWAVPRDLLTIQYSDAPPVTSVAIPDHLRMITALDTSRVTARHVIVMSQGLINGRTMDMHRVDVTSRLGATEIWEIQNVVTMDHPFHLHGFQFQILDRNGVPEPYPSWKDVVNVPKHESVRFIVRLDDFPGEFMFHCHILDHEDHGMMGILEVRPPLTRRKR